MKDRNEVSCLVCSLVHTHTHTHTIAMRIVFVNGKVTLLGGGAGDGVKRVMSWGWMANTSMSV